MARRDRFFQGRGKRPTEPRPSLFRHGRPRRDGLDVSLSKGGIADDISVPERPGQFHVAQGRKVYPEIGG